MKTLAILTPNFLKSFLFASVITCAITAHAGNGPVANNPAKPVSFTAVLDKNNKVDLKWSTQTESHLSHFVVEKSTDGKNFSDAALVFAYGNTTSESAYAFADNISKIRSGYVYYRLCTVNEDGALQYSDPRVVQIIRKAESNLTVQASLDPVTNELRIKIPAAWQNKKLTYGFFNANGTPIKMGATSRSNPVETINIESIVPGLYIVTVTCDGETAQQKVIRQ